MLWNFVRYSNIDVAAGAVVTSLAIAEILKIKLDLVSMILLFNAVWIIYTLDRILDTAKSNFQDSPRHTFHYKNRKWLLTIIILTGLFSLPLLFWIEAKTLFFGLMLSGLVLLYLFSLWMNWKIPKEIIISVIYSAGIFLAPVSVKNFWDIMEFLLFVQITLMALTNLLIISWYEKKRDYDNGQVNLAFRLSKTFVLVLFTLFLVHVFMTIVVIQLGGSGVGQIVFSLMWLVFFSTWFLKDYFSKHERYASCLDSAFFLPGLILIL